MLLVGMAASFHQQVQTARAAMTSCGCIVRHECDTNKVISFALRIARMAYSVVGHEWPTTLYLSYKELL